MVARREEQARADGDEKAGGRKSSQLDGDGRLGGNRRGGAPPCGDRRHTLSFGLRGGCRPNLATITGLFQTGNGKPATFHHPDTLGPAFRSSRFNRSGMPIRVAIADDSVLVLEGLQQLLAARPDIEVVAACADMPSLLRAVEVVRPDVVVSDIRMPPSNTDEGIQVAVRLRQLHPEVGVVILSQYAEPMYALKLLEAGSDGRAYLLKERVRDPAQLVSAIESVAAGGSVIDPKVVEMLVAANAPPGRPSLAKLTSREQEVLADIAQGKSNTAIAESLVLSKRAVEKHINSIFFKLGLSEAEDVSKRVKAALLFLYDGATEGGDGSAPR